MQQTKVDYIIVGLGIAGTWLSYELLERGKSIIVINQDAEQTSSKKAAGLYNPITGRKMVKTWRADDLFHDLEKRYQTLETLTGEHFLHPKPIYRPFPSIADQNDWYARQSDEALNSYLEGVHFNSLNIDKIHDPFGGIIIRKCGYVDLPRLLESYKKYLIDKGIYQEEVFDYTAMQESNNAVMYNNLRADKIIFCEGPFPSRPWEYLPFRPVRGELIDIECDLPDTHIINQGVFILPKQNYFTVGSTYDHDLLTFEPQKRGIEDIERRLSKIFEGKYRILDTRAGVRPSTHDRRPYIGFHKKSRTLGIFNGFGTKGVSLTPYFAKHFVNVLEDNVEIEKEVNVERVS